MENTFNYKNLHQYLEEAIDGIEPSDELIIKCKKDYWRAYNTNLKRQKRKKFKHINLSFDKLQYKSLERICGETPMHLFLKEMILTYQDSESYPMPANYQKKDLFQIEQKLFLIIDLLQNLLYSRTFIDPQLSARLEKLLIELQNLLESKF